MENVLLKIDSFSKHFRSHWTFRPIQAVREVSLEIYEGESFGFLGHNGAGKTTTMKCILGLIQKSNGRILLHGEELISASQRTQIGYLPEHPYFYDHLTVEETLDFLASLHDIKRKDRKSRVPETLKLVGLLDRRHASVRSLSKGLQQRLGFAQAIINRPKLLLLDEPFSGLDPLGRLEIRKLILNLKQTGTTIFLSSHILSDVEDICDRVAIMAKGQLKTVFNLKESPKLFGESYELRVLDAPGREELLSKLSHIAEEHVKEHTASEIHHLFHFADYHSAETALSEAVAARAKIEAFKSSGPSLEDIFMNITQEDENDLEHKNPRRLTEQVPQ